MIRIAACTLKCNVQKDPDWEDIFVLSVREDAVVRRRGDELDAGLGVFRRAMRPLTS